MKHFVKVEIGPNKGLIYTMPTKKRAAEAIRVYQRRFNNDYAAHYGNERDGFVEQQIKSGARFMEKIQ